MRDGCLLLVVSLELRTSWGQSVLGGRAAVGGLRTLELASSECVCSKLLKGGQARRGRPARTWPTLENAPIHQLHCETSGFVLAERSHPRQETGGGGKRCDKFDAVFFFFLIRTSSTEHRRGTAERNETDVRDAEAVHRRPTPVHVRDPAVLTLTSCNHTPQIPLQLPPQIP